MKIQITKKKKRLLSNAKIKRYKRDFLMEEKLAMKRMSKSKREKLKFMRFKTMKVDFKLVNKTKHVYKDIIVTDKVPATVDVKDIRPPPTRTRKMPDGSKVLEWHIKRMMPKEKKKFHYNLDRKKKKKRRKYALVLFILLFLFTSLLFIYIAPEFKELNMSLQVADRLGVDVSHTEIIFGTVPPGGTSTREVIVSNLNDYDKLVQFSIEGTIKDFVDTPADRFLKANENITMNVRANVPINAEPGNYTGKFNIFLRRAI